MTNINNISEFGIWSRASMGLRKNNRGLGGFQIWHIASIGHPGGNEKWNEGQAIDC